MDVEAAMQNQPVIFSSLPSNLKMGSRLYHHIDFLLEKRSHLAVLDHEASKENSLKGLALSHHCAGSPLYNLFHDLRKIGACKPEDFAYALHLCSFQKTVFLKEMMMTK